MPFTNRFSIGINNGGFSIGVGPQIILSLSFVNVVIFNPLTNASFLDLIDISFSKFILLLPIVFIQVVAFSLGCGIIISAVTTKYRDLKIVVNFGMQLWMYVTPVVYPLSSITGDLKTIMLINPMSISCEIFRKALLNSGDINLGALIYSVVISIGVFLLGVCMFNKVERISIDTV